MAPATDFGLLLDTSSLTALMRFVEEHISDRGVHAKANFVVQRYKQFSKAEIDLICAVGEADFGEIYGYSAVTDLANLVTDIDRLICRALTVGSNKLEGLVKALRKLRERCPIIAHHPLACEAFLRHHRPDLLGLLGLEK